MNPLLSRLQPYPFERLRQLFAGVTPNPAFRADQPGHRRAQASDAAVHQGRACAAALDGAGRLSGDRRRAARCASAFRRWLQRRYGLAVDPATQVLPVNGSREALFAFAQTVIDPAAGGAVVVCPNPFYQIYEGAALLAGAEPYYVPSDPARNFAVDWDSVPAEVWARTQLLYVCSPGNPTGAVMPLDEWKKLFALSDRHGFVIASDECYCEIYFRDEPPLGGLEAAARLGRARLPQPGRRSPACPSAATCPGMRSGFVAGDAALIKKFLLYRTYHGSAMSPAGAAGQHRGLERRAACGREPRPVPRQVRRKSRRCSSRGARRAAARRRLLPVGRRAREATPNSRGTCWLNTM